MAAKLTKTQRDSLVQVWTVKTAWGANGHRLTKDQAASIGCATLNGNTTYSLLSKGLVRRYTTTHTVLGYRVQVLVLTDLGRAAIGV